MAGVAGQLGAAAGFDHGLVQTLGQLIGRKVGESPRKSGRGGHLARTVVTAELAQGGPGQQLVDQGLGGREAIDRLGHKRLEEAEPGGGRTPVAAPLVSLEKGFDRDQRHDFNEAAVVVAEGPQFLLEGGEKLALQTAPKLEEMEGHIC